MAQMNAKLRALAENDPQEFRKLMAMARSKVITPHPFQQVVVDSKARFRVINAGRRFGKSVISAKILVTKARQPNLLLWYVAPQYKNVKRGYAEILKQLPDGVLAKPAPPDTNFDAGRSVSLQFKNGTRIEFYSAERPEGMLGASTDFVVLDEAALMSGSIWNRVVSPTLIDRLGGALMISTPRGRNWFYKVWQNGQDPEQTDWESWTFVTSDNPKLPPGEADRMAADLPRMEAEQEIYAKWLAAGSSVFMIDRESVDTGILMPNGMIFEPDEQGNPRDQREISGAVFLGVDLGRTNDYTVLYGTLESNRKNVYFARFTDLAWEEQRRRIRRAVGQLMRAGAEYVMLMVDEGNGGTIIKEDFEEAGFSVEGVNFTTHKQNMVRLLANDLEVQHAFLLDEMLVEFENYTMTMSEAGRMKYSAPEGEHDDVVSSKLLSHWGCVNFGAGDVKLLEATSGPAVPEDDRDPWDDFDDDGSDLLDDPIEAAVAIGYDDPRVMPTFQELVTREDLWL